MYEARFETDNNKNFRFGYKYGTIFDISDLSGVTADISTSQGFAQIGESIENYSTGGITRQVNGKILSEIPKTKIDMMKIFGFGTTGKLFFNDRYFSKCMVKTTPQFGVGEKNNVFLLEFFFPYPYWQFYLNNSFVIGGFSPAFRFPVNYSTPHIFGIKNQDAFTNCENNGAVDVDFKAEFTASSAVKNYGIINALTLQTLKFNDTISLGEKLIIWRENGRLRVEKNGVDAFNLLDDSSDFFQMKTGDNIVRTNAESGVENLIVSIEFSDTYSGVFDGM